MSGSPGRTGGARIPRGWGQFGGPAVAAALHVRGRETPGRGPPGSPARASATLSPGAAASLSLGGAAGAPGALSPLAGRAPSRLPAGPGRRGDGRSPLLGLPRQGLRPRGRRGGGRAGSRPCPHPPFPTGPYTLGWPFPWLPHSDSGPS